MALTKVQTIGIETGISLTGVTTVTTLNASTDTLSVGGTVNFGGNVSIAGTLTYEDVTNIDSVGIITARSGVKFGESGTTIFGNSTGIGIGEASPTRKLVVAGDTNTVAVVRGATNGTSNLFLGDTDDEDIGALTYNHPSNYLSVTVNASEVARFDSSGNFGLDTTNPQAPFVVSNSGNQGVEIGYSGGSSSNYVQAYNRSSSAFIQLDVVGSPLLFKTGSSATERARIDSSGRLGIGESSPDRLLHLKAASSTAYSGGSDSADYNFLKIENTTDDKSAGIFFAIGSNGEAAITATEVADGNTDIAFQNRGGGVRSEKMRIDSSGNMGLGTTSNYDDSPLEVRKTAGGDGVAIRVTNNTTTDGSQSGIIFTTTTSDFTSAAIAHKRNDNALIFYNGQSAGGGGFANAYERMRVDSSGRLLVGVDSSKESLSMIQCVSSSESTLSIFTSATSASGKAKINMGPSNNITGAQIICDAEEDFSTGANRTGRLSFTTRRDGTITERLRITSQGYLKAANNASYYDDDGPHHELNQSGTDVNMIFRTTAPNTAATQVYLGVDRAATSAYWFLQGVSSFSGSADTEFYIRGDGNAFADGTWSGGGADYAEYFEWSDGNTEAEDRRGISVVLDGDKIREAVAGEEPIGVISGNPSVVGDADVDRWKNKYLRDDYGSYVLDEDGYRQLNPDYNSSVEYVQREDRPEWDTVGLMGKLRVRKGQVTGTRWIKMRDVSNTVEEWLIR